MHADTRLKPNHTPTHSTGELGRKRPASARATTASESSAHFSSHRVLLQLPRLSLCLSVRFRRLNALIGHPRPNVPWEGQSAWCGARPTLYPWLQISFNAQHNIYFLCSTCLPHRLSFSPKLGWLTALPPGDSHQTARLNYNIPPPFPSLLHNVHHQFNQAGC